VFEGSDQGIVFEIPSNILLKKLRPHVWREIIFTRYLLSPTDIKVYPFAFSYSIDMHVHVRIGHNTSGIASELQWDPSDEIFLGGV
jgi:hypothetical protein